MAVIQGGEGVYPVESNPKAKCRVLFRPHDAYEGEYGFDWLREEDSGLANEPAYEGIIEGGYKDGKSDLSSAEAYKALKTEYNRFPIWGFGNHGTWTDDRGYSIGFGEYFVPYLNLFPKPFCNTVDYSPAPPYEAKLKVLVEIKDIIEFEYNNEFLSIDGQGMFRLKDKSICPLKVSDNDTLTISCIKDISAYQDGEVKVYAHFTNDEGEFRKTLAGKLLVCPNDRNNRKEAKIVMVHVKTAFHPGERRPSDIIALRQFFYQALVVPSIICETQNKNGYNEDIALDVENEFDYTGRGRFINPTGDIIFDMQLIKDLARKFRDLRISSQYGKYFKIFIIGSECVGLKYTGMANPVYDSSNNQIGFFKEAVVFSNRAESSVVHEIMHCCQLFHTHNSSPPLVAKNAKYIYPEKGTDNMMSYNAKRQTTWHWQWKIIRNNL